MSSLHFYGWKAGLKTGMYYLRRRPAADPIQFTVDKARLAASRALNKETNGTTNGDLNTTPLNSKSFNGSMLDEEKNGDGADTEELKKQMAKLVCSRENKDDCMMCGS